MLKPLLILLVLINISCKSDDLKADVPQEQIFINGAIYTVNSAQVWAEAMRVIDGRIIAIGTDEEIEAQSSRNALRVNLRGRMVMPGIHDVHMHPLEASSSNFQFNLDLDESNPEGYVTDIQQALQSNANASWLLGWGHDFHVLLSGNREPIEILDAISTNKPIAILEMTSHSVWVNSKALELAQIDSTTQDPHGGIYMKDSLGRLNGILVDNAGNLIIDMAVASIPYNLENDYDGLLNFGLPELARYGITSICDARSYWKRNHHQVWQRLENEGNLTARVNLGLWLYPTELDNIQINTIKSLYSNDPNSFLKINQVKLYSDGIVSNTTSAMKADYLIDLFNKPTNNGLNYFDQIRIEQYISALEPMGFDFHIHTIGNRGVTEALDAIENASNGSGRHRLTHVEYVDPTDYPRFNQLNVTADAQVAGDFSQPAHWHDNDVFVTSNLNTNLIPLKSLSAANARLTLSSDWDVSTLNPFIGLMNAVQRNPEEISLEEAIRAYTINGAYVMRQENLVGSLEVGKMADFIVLDQNLFNIPTNHIGQTEVLQTYLAGEIIYQR